MWPTAPCTSRAWTASCSIRTARTCATIPRAAPPRATASPRHHPRGRQRFAGNLFLKSVSYPTTLERIGTKAFFGCENLKDYYFNGMTAPLLETTVSLTGAYANVALYANFVGLWGTTGTGGFVYNDWGLNLYYPQGAVGYTAYVWDKYFNTEKGSVNIMDESYFTPTDLTVTETGRPQRPADLDRCQAVQRRGYRL